MVLNNKKADINNNHDIHIVWPIVFLPIAVRTSGRVYYDEDFVRLFFLHVERETSILAGELPEESEQFRFLRVVYTDFHTFASLFELSSSTSSS